ncbi:extracellular solute-binding protein [Solihabitans fulvus]|uniref:Extracellular solute-binding protein n=1 Tax=Solihabitans fulvus TaxID=1892852 RepID=A0A5B2WP04_9PSEU|nr:extracellular solute-binding protein [Solihabitans fulvus]KAA2252226.1 extracellular solute-binding protein [Solihabitans fulvus]
MLYRVLAIVAVLLLAVGGCSSGQGAGQRTLKLWHYEGPDSAMGAAWALAVKQFEAAHPDVKVVLEEKGFEQIRKTAPMVLNSKDAPDVLEYDKGNATSGLLARQGLLTDLTDEVTRRGWDKLVTGESQTTARYDDKGVMGSGRWYGVPNYAEYVSIYYNKDQFAKYGIAVPTTLDQLTAAMDKFVAAGITPLASAGQEYPAQQLMYELALTKASRDWVDRYQRYTGKVDFHDAAWTYGATTFADWVHKGYLSKDSVGAKAEDMGLSFIQGRSPIMVTGSWWFGRLVKDVKDFQWGSVLWPGLTAGSAGNMWVVPKGSKNKDLAYDFIAITMSPPVQDALRDAGGVPLVRNGSASDPKAKEVTDNFGVLSTQDRLAFYPDWPAPGYYDELVSAVQKLTTGTATPSQVLDEIAKPYQENLANVGR